ncbi:metallophosphoesterase [Haladaptatus sp. DYSN1]|uniref:metallophosphoesterase n=1 Tax=unclassified Haladaptatus TaxID=2622732 RepID=UPI00240742DC|nr:metallophosphoesterase [Haladaptatus sp. DYSN1]
MASSVEPIPGQAAAIADLSRERALVVADYHAGLEVALRWDGVSVPSKAPARREQLVRLREESNTDRVIVLGDFGNAIGAGSNEEIEEIHTLLAALDCPVTVVKGNHDGDIEEHIDGIDVTPAHGIRLGDVGFAHGHTWPAPDVLDAEILCTAHEHPQVRLTDDVGGQRTERVWLRGTVDPAPFAEFHGREFDGGAPFVVFPAFNDLVGGTWVNVQEDGFLSPFLPAGLRDGEAYLLDGTRLGNYDRI